MGLDTSIVTTSDVVAAPVPSQDLFMVWLGVPVDELMIATYR